MRPLSTAIPRLLFGLVTLLALTPAARAQGVSGRVPVTLINGRVVVSCDLSTRFRRIPANLFVEYEGAFALQLHNKAAAGLRCESADGTTVPIRIHFPDFDLGVERREHGDEAYLDRFTKYHSKELGENAVVGTIGAELLGEHQLIFDLARGFIEFAPPEVESPEPIQAELLEGGTAVVPLTEHAGLLWFPLRLEDGSPASLALGCARFDTWIDRMLCEELGAPAGDVGSVRLGPFDLSRYVAFRPEEVVLTHPDGVFGVFGANLLEHFTVQVDRVNRVARITPSRPPEFPEEDLAFFRARAEEDADEMEGFLEQHGDVRLAHEAAELLLALRFDEGAGAEATAGAVQWLCETTLEDLRTTRMLDLMKDLADEGRFDEVLAAGALGIESGRDDRYPNAVHEVHGRMGRVRLHRDEGREAWRHLLSAAFGLPEDGPINLDLGRYYESQGRYRRAFSRYVQAVIRPDSGPEALVALARVQPLIDSGEPFSVDLVERMIAGKVRNFGASSVFEPEGDEPAYRTVLCEFFTNAYLGDESRGAIGGALANEGLTQHFDAEHVVFLSHHLPDPQVDPLCTSLGASRAAQLGVEGPYVHVIDGVAQGPGAARWRQAEGVYNAVKARILRRLQTDSEYEIEGDARVESGRATGTISLTGLGVEGPVLRVVLCERGVLFPGKTGVVVHRYLARAELTPPGGLAYVEDEDGWCTFEFDASLADLTSSLEQHLDQLEADGVGSCVRLSTTIAPEEVRIVAWVEDPLTGESHQVALIEPMTPEREEAESRRALGVDDEEAGRPAPGERR